MQNYKKYAIPPAQLIIADVPYNVGKIFTAAILCGTTVEITRMERANLQEKQHSIQILILICMSTSIFAARCLRKNPRKQGTEEEVQMHHV